MKKLTLTNALLWAAAILAAAIGGAPVFLSLILLPCLATMSLLATRRAGRRSEA